MANAKDITDLRNQLLEAFDQLQKDPRRINQVQELSNTAGKIIGTLKTQLEYSMLRCEVPEIPFMGKTSGIPISSVKTNLLKS